MANGDYEREKDLYRLSVIEGEIIPALEKLDMPASLRAYKQQSRELRAKHDMRQIYDEP